MEQKNRRDRVNFEISTELRTMLKELISTGEYVTEAELMRKALCIGLHEIKRTREAN